MLLLGSKFAECKQESECKLLMSLGAGARVTFFGTGAGPKKSLRSPLDHTVQAGWANDV